MTKVPQTGRCIKIVKRWPSTTEDIVSLCAMPEEPSDADLFVSPQMRQRKNGADEIYTGVAVSVLDATVASRMIQDDIEDEHDIAESYR